VLPVVWGDKRDFGSCSSFSLHVGVKAFAEIEHLGGSTGHDDRIEERLTQVHISFHDSRVDDFMDTRVLQAD
jgi:hypothetical protein